VKPAWESDKSSLTVQFRKSVPNFAACGHHLLHQICSFFMGQVMYNLMIHAWSIHWWPDCTPFGSRSWRQTSSTILQKSFFCEEDVSHSSSQTSLKFTKSPISEVSSICSSLCRESLLEVVCWHHLLLLHYDLQFLHHRSMYALMIINSPPQAVLMMMRFRVYDWLKPQ
jgi:hypothetical protein